MTKGPSKFNANVNLTLGAIKQNIGSAFGNHSLKSRGAVQRAKGNSEYKVSKAKGYSEGVKDGFKGNFKNIIGSVIGNQQMKLEGKASKSKGEFKRKINS